MFGVYRKVATSPIQRDQPTRSGLEGCRPRRSAWKPSVSTVGLSGMLVARDYGAIYWSGPMGSFPEISQRLGLVLFTKSGCTQFLLFFFYLFSHTSYQ